MFQVISSHDVHVIQLSSVVHTLSPAWALHNTHVMCIEFHSNMATDIKHMQTAFHCGRPKCVKVVRYGWYPFPGKEWQFEINPDFASQVQQELSRTPTFWIYPLQTPLKSTKKAGLISWCVRVFNPMKDLDTKDTYTRNFLNSIKKKLIYCPDTSHECAARLIRKCVKFFEKYTYWNLAKPGTYITCALKVSYQVWR